MNLPPSTVRLWLNTARMDHVVKRSTKVSLVVGSILIIINHGDALLAGQAGSALLWKVPFTYCVPYAVSTFAAVDAILHR